MILEDYGWDSWFDTQYKSLNMQLKAGRVTGNSDIYKIICADGEIEAEVSQRLFYSTSSDSELPVAGDWVLIIPDDSDTGYSIYDILPRRSFLVMAGQDTPDEQIPVAANVDYILAALPAGDGTCIPFIENMIDISRDWGAEPLFLYYGKSDDQERKKISEAAGGAEIVFIDNLDREGLSQLDKTLTPRKTYALTGVNDGDVSFILDSLTEGKISRSTEGEDSEESSMLYMLTSSALLLSTPLPGDIGFNNGPDNHNGSGDGDDFGDILEIAGSCRFNDCSHVNEPDCAILEALENGDLDYDHYKKFLKALRKEAGGVHITELPEMNRQKRIIAVKSERGSDL